jgi:hypothetical protein
VFRPGGPGRGGAPAQANADILEDLGIATVNGIAANGTRVTTVVPAGAIRNNREFRSVSQRWFSPDLNVLVKSVNTELTNINPQAPDPALFRPPAR